MPARIRPNVLRMRSYSPGRPDDEHRHELGLESLIKLAGNENPLGPSPLAVEAVKLAAANMHLYPDALAAPLREAIGRRFEISAGQVLTGNGSDALIHLLGLVLLDDEEDEVVVGSPSFVRYDAAAELAPCRLVKIPLDPNGVHDLPAMRGAISEKTRLIFIANPNNPTGTVVRKHEMDRFLQDIPGHVVTVLDEAYFEFAADLPDLPNSLEYVRAGRQVVGLRTFSKSHGLAGIRIGYGFAPLDIAEAIDRVRGPFHVNSLAQVAAIAALEDQEHLRRTISHSRAGVERIDGFLRSLGFPPYESHANFVCADFGTSAQEMCDALLQEGVQVRLLEGRYLRISAGTDAEMDVLEEALAAVTPRQTPRSSDFRSRRRASGCS